MRLYASNKDLPRHEQLAFWADLVSRALAPVSFSASAEGGFPASASVLDLGPVRVAAFTSPPAYMSRTVANIRRADPATYQLTFVTGSPLWMNQRRQDSGLVLGDMVLFDVSYPFDGEVPDRGRHTEVVIMQIPHQDLSLPQNKVRQLLARPLSARTGMGAILARFMSTLDSYGPDCDRRDLSRLGTTALDLTAACLAQHLGAYGDLPAETRRQALLARIDAFIEHNIDDPDLAPRDIATHHHISVRSLHALFRQQGETVAASIRRRRLERCHADLTDPRLRQRPISAIAARWGMPSPTDFSRAFRTAYGVTPREVRRAALGGLDARPRTTSQETSHSLPTAEPVRRAR